MKNNVIPRKAKKMKVTFKIDAGASHNGDTVIVEKTDRGWIGNHKDGKSYFHFVSMLRNGDICCLEVIE